MKTKIVAVMLACLSALTACGDGGGSNIEPLKKIVFMGTQSGSIYSDIYVINQDGSDITNLTNTADKNDYYPLWSPDGTKIAFASERDGNFNIYLRDVNNTIPQRLTDSSADDKQHSWSTDGTKIVFVSERDMAGRGQIYVMNADGANQTRLVFDTTLNCMLPKWQP